jgi:hypothetical protein
VSRRAILVGVLGLGGLLLYLWPALRAPVVLWSDSAIDLAWAREGVGVVSPAPLPDVAHPAKPAYLAFLRAATLGATDGEAPRRIVSAGSLDWWAREGAP